MDYYCCNIWIAADAEITIPNNPLSYQTGHFQFHSKSTCYIVSSARNRSMTTVNGKTGFPSSFRERLEPEQATEHDQSQHKAGCIHAHKPSQQGATTKSMDSVGACIHLPSSGLQDKTHLINFLWPYAPKVRAARTCPQNQSSL